MLREPTYQRRKMDLTKDLVNSIHYVFVEVKTIDFASLNLTCFFLLGLFRRRVSQRFVASRERCSILAKQRSQFRRTVREIERVVVTRVDQDIAILAP